MREKDVMNSAAILDTLERASEACADPAPLVYGRLFAAYPHLESLFVMDRDGGVRGSMLETCLNIILGLLEGSETSRFLISAGRMQHEGYGVPAGEFDVMFAAMRDTFRELSGPGWTPEAETAWDALLSEIATIK
jgi:hemoglobin-like flavoprotein